MLVEIYGTESCSFCKKAVKLAEFNNIAYTYTDVGDPEEKANLSLRLGYMPRSVPQIFVDGKHLANGFNELREKLLAL